MNIGDVIEAAEEAKRFLKRVKAYRRRYDDPGHDLLAFDKSPESAALRRASMDLTRALAKMRRR